MYFLAFWCTFALPRGASFHGRFSSLGWRKFTGQWIQKEVGKLSLTKTRTHTNFHAIQRFLHYCCIFASFSFATCLTFFAPVFQCRILPFFYSSITFCWMCSFPIPLGLENAPECRPPHQMTSASSLVWTFFCASSFESKICSKSKNTHTIFNFSIPETFPYAKTYTKNWIFPKNKKKKEIPTVNGKREHRGNYVKRQGERLSSYWPSWHESTRFEPGWLSLREENSGEAAAAAAASASTHTSLHVSTVGFRAGKVSPTGVEMDRVTEKRGQFTWIW